MSTAALEFGTLLRDLPSFWWDSHPVRQIQFAYRFNYANKLWGKREAVRLAVLASMEAVEARGKGYKAAKRCAILGAATAERIAIINERVTYFRKQREADERAERWSESRTSKHQQAYLAMCPHE